MRSCLRKGVRLACFPPLLRLGEVEGVALMLLPLAWAPLDIQQWGRQKWGRRCCTKRDSTPPLQKGGSDSAGEPVRTGGGSAPTYLR
jgi:hypothetical protein